LKVDRTECQNTLVANQQKGAYTLLMRGGACVAYVHEFREKNFKIRLWSIWVGVRLFLVSSNPL